MKFNEFSKILHDQKSNKSELLSRLKNECSFDKIKRTLTNLHANPTLKVYLLGRPFPKKISNIRESPSALYSSSLEGEIAWNVFAITRYSYEINNFIELKNMYDRLLFVNDLTSAKNILETIQEKFGYSFWLIENKFLLEQELGGTQENWRLLSETVSENSNAFVNFIFDNLSKRVELNMSNNQFRNIFLNILNDSKNNDGMTIFGEYLCFRLNYFNYTGYTNYSYFLHLENTSPLIDRYLLLRDIFSHLTSSNEIEYNSLILLSIEDMKNSKINDPVLDGIYYILTGEKLARKNGSIEFYRLIEQYTSGKFSDALSLSEYYYDKLMPAIEFLEIHNKLLLELDRELIDTIDTRLIDKIKIHLYNIILRNSNYQHSLEVLEKICLTYYATNWSKQLYCVMNKYSSSYSHPDLLARYNVIYSSIDNPNSLSVFKNNESLLENAYKTFSNLFSRSLSLEINYNICKGNYSAIEALYDSINYRRDLYLAKAYYNSEKFEESCRLLEMLSNKSVSKLTSEEVTFFLFNCYHKLGLYCEAISLYLNLYLCNLNGNRKIETKEFIKDISNNHYNCISCYIELSIFLKITNSDSYDIYIGYDYYLSSYNVNRASQLFELDNFSPDSLQIYFLREVCTTEVLRQSPLFSSSEELFNERISILNELIRIDRDNDERYIKEITELRQTLSIQDAIREVNRGRITVNVPELIRIESNRVKEDFFRFIELERYNTTTGKLLIYDSSTAIKSIEHGLQAKSSPSYTLLIKSDAAFIAYKNIFLELREKFLFSKEFGLDGYLSTRIRHGTLFNHIRSIFENHKLVSQKDTDSKYVENTYWLEKVDPYDIRSKELINQYLVSFAENVDKYTEIIIKEYMQIQTERVSKGVESYFDYRITNEELMQLYLNYVLGKNLNNNQFVELIFEYLVYRTGQLLKRIKRFFVTEIKACYLSHLNNLSTLLRSDLVKSTIPDLFTAISKCSTEIQDELSAISEWFEFSTPSRDFLIELKTAIQSAIEICNTIHPTYKLEPIVEIRFELDVKSDLNLIYIIKILLENIVAHSQINPADQRIYIICELNDSNILKMSICNKISPNIDQKVLSEKLSNVKKKWSSDVANFDNTNIEGGSGFDKIRKILLLDMGNSNFNFEFSIDNDQLDLSIYFTLTLNHENIANRG